jgi:hypothetical protein
MAVSHCPYWRCEKCRAVHEKKDLAEMVRRLRGRRIEEELPGNFRCPKCHTLHAKADVYTGRHDVPEDSLVDDAEPDERKRRKSRSRREALGWVNVGLAIHYGGMGAFLLGLIAGWLALITLMIALSRLSVLRPDETPSGSIIGTLLASGVLFLVSNCLTACSSLADVVSSAFCLSVPDASARGFLIGALCTRLVALPVGVVLLFFVPYGWAMLTSLVLALIGWGLWVIFLRNLALYLKQPVLAQEAVDVTLSAIKFGLAWAVMMATLIGFLFLLVNMKRVGGCFFGFFVASFVAGATGLLRYLVMTDRFGSLTNLLLYPTGIPLIMRYMDLIGTLRMIILRRA